LLNILDFLKKNVEENIIYILKRDKYLPNEKNRYIKLYEVDKEHEFINKKLLTKL